MRRMEMVMVLRGVAPLRFDRFVGSRNFMKEGIFFFKELHNCQQNFIR